MITIRYADLPEGLHAQAQAHGRHTVIYLRPGLTAEQRRRGLRRARQSARMGYGPRLPGPGVALAVARHVAAGTLWNLGAAVRRHPIGFLVLSAGLAMLMACYVLFVTVSIRLMLDPAQVPAAARGSLPAQVVPAPLAPHPGGGALPGRAVRVPRRPRGTGDSPRVSAEKDRRARQRGPAGQAAPSAASPSPSPASAPPRPAASPRPDAAPSPSPGVCVTVGPIGVCL
jgi:hypothetical protein